MQATKNTLCSRAKSTRSCRPLSLREYISAYEALNTRVPDRIHSMSATYSCALSAQMTTIHTKCSMKRQG